MPASSLDVPTPPAWPGLMLLAFPRLGVVTILFSFLFFFLSKWPHLRYMEVPKRGVATATVEAVPSGYTVSRTGSPHLLCTVLSRILGGGQDQKAKPAFFFPLKGCGHWPGG